MKNTIVPRLFASAARIVTLSIIAVAVIALSPGRAAAQANIVGNGGFETPAISNGSTTINPGATLTPWSVSGASIKLNRNTGHDDDDDEGGPAPEGVQWIDLTGKGGTISQPLATSPGRSYKLSFKYTTQIGSRPGVTVKWGPSGSPTFTETISANKSWATAERTLTATSASTILSFTSAGGNNNFGVQLDAVTVTALPLVAAPTLIRAISTSATDVFLIGRVDGAPNASISVRASTAASCANGALPGGGTPAGTASTTTDANGYFGVSVSGVAPDSFVSVQTTTPTLSAASQCLASAADNDSWPKALDITSASSQFSSSGFIDEPGKTRWFKFKVVPGQRIQVTLSGLPADYDLAVFKDIGQLFDSTLVPGNAAALTKVSAEYAPSAFTPSAFTPSAFTPSAFTPSAFTPSAFTPSAFTPSAFTPSAFTPSAFTPSAFSPSAFTPSAFTPSAFTPSAFTPSAFTPSAFTPSAFTGPGAFTVAEIQQAFSSAQTRSILGASATLGLGNESVVVNSWSNTGNFYVRVASHGGAYSTGSKFTVSVDQGVTTCAGVTDYTITKPADRTVTGGSFMTVILTDSSSVRQNAGTTAQAGAALVATLNTFAVRSDINGVVVDVASDARVQALKTQAASNKACPVAMNLVAQEIKSIVDAYRISSPVRYVVIAGNDAAVPFFRYPDESLLAQESGYVPPLDSNSASDASLRRDYVLSQDAYGSSVQLSLRSSTIPVPGLAVGRLVETAADIGGLLTAYADASGSIAPQSTLVTGYDFLADAADAVTQEFATGTGRTPDTLITAKSVSPQDPASWSASSLAGKLFGSRHDLVFLAGHFSANDTLAADYTTNLLTTDLAASTADFKNSIVFSAGCHAGYNIVDADILPGVTLPLDWAQAFAAKQATLIAGTGYQYGDTDFIEYSERLYLNFARQLRAGTGAVAVGEALVKAKLQYAASTPDMRGIHQKAFLEATLFGLPMLGVNMPSGRTTINAIAPAITPLPVATGTGGAPLGLMTKKVTYAPTDPLLPNVTWVPAAPLQPQTATLDTVPPTSSYLASYLSGPDGVTTNPFEPVLPLVAINVTPNVSGIVLRGVGFLGGSYVDTTPILPLTGAPATEIRGVHTQFQSAQFFPMRMWTPNHFPALGGGVGTNLLFTPVQHRASTATLGSTTRRVYTNLDLRLYYSGNLSQASLSDAPAIVSVDGQFDGGGIAFTVRVVGDPAAAMQDVWITYADGGGTWTPFNLAQCVGGTCPGINDSQLWKGHLPLAALPPNFKYIVQAANGIGLVSYDDKLGGYYSVGTPVATTLTLNAPPSAGTFGETKAVSATLLSSGSPVSGKIVTIGVGGTAQVGLTDGNGNVTVNVPLQTLPGSYQLTAAFGGDEGFLPASTSVPFAVAQATTNLTWLATPATTLTGSLGGTPSPLLQEAITYLVSQNGVALKTFVVNTNLTGLAPLPPTGLPAGSYTVVASFAGNSTYAAATATLPALVIVPQTISFNGNAALPNPITVGGTPVTFTVSSSASQPVTVVLAPPVPLPGPYCTLTAVGNVYTLTAVAPGICTITASAKGTTTSASVTVTQDITVAKITQTIAFGALAARTYGDAPFTVGATASSGLPVTFAASGAACTIAGNTVTIVAAGSCTITASQAGNATYDVAPPVPQVLTVNQAAQVVTFGTVGSKTFGDPAFTVSATGGASGNPVTFSSSGACTTSGTNGATVAITSAGICTLMANQAGNVNYLAGQAQLSFSIGKASQSITFAGPGNLTLGVPANNQVTLTATATSGLSVSFAATPAGVCTASGATLTMVAAGSCTITASQAGDANFSAAIPVVRTIIISSSDLPNVWTKVTAPMTKKRFEHTATRFEMGQPLGGQVLIAGGYDRTGTAQLTAELYNPATRTFVATGSMLTKAAGHTATLLLDGKVVVIGGGNAKVQRFDPTPRTWSQLPTSMSSNRTWHTATRLPDGRVLVIGGYDSSGNTMSSTIVYDPTGSGSFTNGPTLDTPRKQHTATLLTSGPNAGKVLVVGGRKKSGSGYVTLATYQICGASVPMGPITCTSSTGGIAGRYAHAAVALGPTGDKVLVVGGTNGSSDLASAELYDAVTGTWAASGSLGVLSPGRSDLTVSELPNGRALAVGGSFNGNARKDADAYTPPIAAMADMFTTRAGHTATPLKDAAGNITGILVTGGADGDADEDDALDSAEIYGTP